MGPEDLNDVLRSLPRAPRGSKVLVGPSTWDDAGVYRLSPRLALVQTVDFITPVVNDPYDYGRIAAANALSDVYAMGGTPAAALSIVCFPEGEDKTILKEMLRGGAETLRLAKTALLGGHTVRDPEIKFGFAVTGTIEPKRVVTNAGAKAGDLLVLTKPLGTGILATALKRRLLGRKDLLALTKQMTALNREAAAAMTAERASAATDVTGFGLLGHALNVARASRKTIRLWSRAVPHLSAAPGFLAQGVWAKGLDSNLAYAGAETLWDDDVEEGTRRLLADPQTSGGLLVAIAPSRVNALLARLTRARVRGAVVGEVLPRRPRPLEVVA
ncbi:MAG TPA: selenide, water dikinase SelD [Candidatus Eisenbacteria bacterium]|nr:selenide, water dikinase SelD [Candidatus Eisenbacteria bacterium]